MLNFRQCFTKVEDSTKMKICCSQPAPPTPPHPLAADASTLDKFVLVKEVEKISVKIH